MTRAVLAAALALAALAACTKTTTVVHLTGHESGDRETDTRRDERFKSELQDDILASYRRDEPPEIETDMIPPDIGAARIGVGPGDFLVGDELLRAPSRWPLHVDAATPTDPISKELDPRHIFLARDRSAAWVSDDISWRITVCGRIAVVPLRLTSLYAHDGDRWIPVFEHLAFAHTPTPAPDGAPHGTQIKSKQVLAISDELSRVLSLGLFHHTNTMLSLGPEAMLLGPDIHDEWIGPAIATAGFGAAAVAAGDRRVGFVGRSLARATIAYWVGNFDADFPARPGVAGGKIRLRGSFVFEKRDDAWKLVQSHLSEAIDDADLATAVFGTALVSLDPLRVSCDDGAARR